MIPSAAAGSPPVPPLSPYGTLHGSLFCYHANLAAFESIAPDHPSHQPLPSKKCILIGGLSDGLMPTPYTQDLERECHKLGWSFVNPIMSSSYLGKIVIVRSNCFLPLFVISCLLPLDNIILRQDSVMGVLNEIQKKSGEQIVEL